MPISYQLISIAGQTTALVTEKLNQPSRVASAQKIMQGASFVEQVGFLNRSGSVAFYLVTGYSKIKQPSGAVLTVTRENDTLQLSVLRKDINYEN